MTQEILALSNLYKETTKKFRTIKQEYIDDEVEITHIALDSITQYFMELLQAIPKDFYISYNNTLFIKFEKSFYYEDFEHNIQTIPIVLFEDKCVYEKNMVLRESLTNYKCAYGDEKLTHMHLSTLEYLISNWNGIKDVISKAITKELYNLINQRLNTIMDKIKFLEILNDWRI